MSGADRDAYLCAELDRRVTAAARALADQALLLTTPDAPTPGPRTALAAAARPLLDDLVHAAAQADIHLGPGLGAVADALGVSAATAVRRHSGAPADLPLIAALSGDALDARP